MPWAWRAANAMQRHTVQYHVALPPKTSFSALVAMSVAVALVMDVAMTVVLAMMQAVAITA